MNLVCSLIDSIYSVLVYKSTSVLSRMPSAIDSDALAKKMTAASWRFRSVCEEDLDKILND